jgi:hypothetical protein
MILEGSVNAATFEIDNKHNNSFSLFNVYQKYKNIVHEHILWYSL